jgi:hypothetical protein
MDPVSPIDHRIDRLVILAAGVWGQKFEDFVMTPKLAADLAIQTLEEIERHVTALIQGEG